MTDEEWGELVTVDNARQSEFYRTHDRTVECRPMADDLTDEDRAEIAYWYARFNPQPERKPCPPLT